MPAAPINPFELKDVWAVAPLLTAVLTYYRDIKKRLSWVKTKALRIGCLGRVHWFIDVLPNLLVSLVTAVAVLASLAYFGYKIAVAFNAPSWLLAPLAFAYDYYFIAFFIWLVFAILGHFNLISKTFLFLSSKIPRFRRTLGWANASWHIEHDDEAYAIAISRDNEHPFVDAVVRDLATSPRNRHLALRPPDVTDEEAANILYFGHVIEDIYAKARIESGQLIWTPFYETMGLIANKNGRPFSRDGIRAFPIHDRSFFYDVVKHYDHCKPDDMAPLPNATQLEQAVDMACRHLINNWDGDARELGRSWKRYSYYAALRGARNAGLAEGICRQFAKLAVVWGIWPRYSKPKVFELPFNRGIVKLFLERNYLITDAEELRSDDQRLMYCFEEAHRRLLLTSYESIEQTRDPDVVSWRNAERERAVEMGLDWPWMMFYRLDQHVYHLGRIEPRVRWDYSRGTPMIVRQTR